MKMPISQDVPTRAHQDGDAASASPATRSESTTSCRLSYQSGDRIDHFVLVRRIGEGGFGQVWLAHDSRLNREVAVKLPHRRLRGDGNEVKRFAREAAIAAKLNHPNLVRILDAVLTGDQAYIVSEYCPGPTLAQWMARQAEGGN